MNSRAAHLLLAASFAILFAACKEGNIYSTLESEVKVEDLSLPSDITLFDVAVANVAGDDYYYAAAGKLWTIMVATLEDPDPLKREWDENAIVPAPADGICTALAASPFGTNTLFGGFISGSGNLGLFESSASPTTTSATWTAVADADVAGAQISLLKSVDTDNNGISDTLVAVTARQPGAGENYQFSIVKSANGIAFDVLPFGALARPTGDEEKPINDVIFSFRLNAWFATEGAVLYTDKASPGTLTAVTTLTSVTTDEVLYGLFDDGTYIYVASWDDTGDAACAVYYSTDGVTWDRIQVPQEDDGTYPPLTRFAGPVGTDDTLLIGSDGYGYYTLPTSPAIGSLTRFPTTTSPLYAASVMKFFLDGGKNRVFACTSMGGLWRGAVAADGSIEWNLE